MNLALCALFTILVVLWNSSGSRAANPASRFSTTPLSKKINNFNDHAMNVVRSRDLSTSSGCADAWLLQSQEFNETCGGLIKPLNQEEDSSLYPAVCDQGEHCMNEVVDLFSNLVDCPDLTDGTRLYELFGNATAVAWFELKSSFACVRNENDEVCLEIWDQIDEDNLNCTDISNLNMGCCWNWVHEYAACYADGDEGDEDDNMDVNITEFARQCGEVALQNGLPDACAGTPTECTIDSASSLTLGFGAFFTSLILLAF